MIYKRWKFSCLFAAEVARKRGGCAPCSPRSRRGEQNVVISLPEGGGKEA